MSIPSFMHLLLALTDTKLFLQFMNTHVPSKSRIVVLHGAKPRRRSWSSCWVASMLRNTYTQVFHLFLELNSLTKNANPSILRCHLGGGGSGGSGPRRGRWTQRGVGMAPSPLLCLSATPSSTLRSLCGRDVLCTRPHIKVCTRTNYRSYLSLRTKTQRTEGLLRTGR